MEEILKAEKSPFLSVGIKCSILTQNQMSLYSLLHSVAKYSGNQILSDLAELRTRQIQFLFCFSTLFPLLISFPNQIPILRRKQKHNILASYKTMNVIRNPGFVISSFHDMQHGWMYAERHCLIERSIFSPQSKIRRIKIIMSPKQDDSLACFWLKVLRSSL